ncbi:MAG: type II secretion system protein [Minisyncoccia bacterium]
MKKGFTLIELLVVIAILAVLATAVVLVLNPAELLKQGRDATRISDLAALNSAISLWVSDVIAATNWSSAAGLHCTYDATHPNAFSGASACSVIASTTVDGTGWVALDFRLIAAGSPLSKLPMDPNNGASACNKGSPAVCEYAINVSSTVGTYKLATQMESVKFNTGGGSDVTSKDGGTDANWYEVGSNMSL